MRGDFVVSASPRSGSDSGGHERPPFERGFVRRKKIRRKGERV
jgi:hypothetical protein